MARSATTDVLRPATGLVALLIGTTSGEIWASRTGGSGWACAARHLPEIYSVETAEL